MKRICEDCFHVKRTTALGRDRLGCMRARSLPDGKILRPPRDGWEASIERLPQSDLDWRVKGDKCSVEGRNYKPASGGPHT